MRSELLKSKRPVSLDYDTPPAKALVTYPNGFAEFLASKAVMMGFD